jgi:hypothetical protein
MGPTISSGSNRSHVLNSRQILVADSYDAAILMFEQGLLLDPKHLGLPQRLVDARLLQQQVRRVVGQWLKN